MKKQLILAISMLTLTACDNIGSMTLKEAANAPLSESEKIKEYLKDKASSMEVFNVVMEIANCSDKQPIKASEQQCNRTISEVLNKK